MELCTMKNFKYEKYDYSFLEDVKNVCIRCNIDASYANDLASVLQEFVGYPNTEITRARVKNAIAMWAEINGLTINTKDILFLP